MVEFKKVCNGITTKYLTLADTCDSICPITINGNADATCITDCNANPSGSIYTFGGCTVSEDTTVAPPMNQITTQAGTTGDITAAIAEIDKIMANSSMTQNQQFTAIKSVLVALQPNIKTSSQPEKVALAAKIKMLQEKSVYEGLDVSIKSAFDNALADAGGGGKKESSLPLVVVDLGVGLFGPSQEFIANPISVKNVTDEDGNPIYGVDDFEPPSYSTWQNPITAQLTWSAAAMVKFYNIDNKWALYGKVYGDYTALSVEGVKGIEGYDPFTIDRGRLGVAFDVSVKPVDWLMLSLDLGFHGVVFDVDKVTDRAESLDFGYSVPADGSEFGWGVGFSQALSLRLQIHDWGKFSIGWMFQLKLTEDIFSSDKLVETVPVGYPQPDPTYLTLDSIFEAGMLTGPYFTFGH